jgi:hypothetical protein
MNLVADYVMADSNTFDWLSLDYIDISGNNITVSRNVGTNSIDDLSGNHSDFVQAQIGRCDNAPAACNFSNIVLNGNTQIERAAPAASVPFSTFGKSGSIPQQGLTFFVEDWTNVTIINNNLVSSANWGVAAQSLHNAVIANNSAINVGSGTTSGIQVDATGSPGTTSDHVSIYNNIVSYLTTDAVGANSDIQLYDNLVKTKITWWVTGSQQFITAAGNYSGVAPNVNDIITSTALTSIFQMFDTTNGSYDLHLKAGSPAIGAGTATGAPNKIDGTPRTGTVDQGAY